MSDGGQNKDSHYTLKRPPFATAAPAARPIKGLPQQSRTKARNVRVVSVARAQLRPARAGDFSNLKLAAL